MILSGQSVRRSYSFYNIKAFTIRTFTIRAFTIKAFAGGHMAALYSAGGEVLIMRSVHFKKRKVYCLNKIERKCYKNLRRLS